MGPVALIYALEMAVVNKRMHNMIHKTFMISGSVEPLFPLHRTFCCVKYTLRNQYVLSV